MTCTLPETLARRHIALEEKKERLFFREHGAYHELDQVAVSEQILDIELITQHSICLMVESLPFLLFL